VSATTEITDTVRGLDGQASPQVNQCQAFIDQSSGEEVVVVTNELDPQSLLETFHRTFRGQHRRFPRYP
jgi:hypothetical protein